MDISVILITYNNYTLKSGCIETVLLAIQNQICKSFEIIIVDNSSSEADTTKLKNFISSIECPKIKYISNEVNNISTSRNIGAKKAQSELLLFLDDDMLLSNPYILQTVINASNYAVYGLSAVRLWTKKDWYSQNKHFVDNLLRSKNFDDYSKMITSSQPDPKVRKKNNNRHLLRTYIGNFGFVKKEALINVGLWDEKIKGYGTEDDLLTFVLYMKYGNPFLMNDIQVYHIWHEISENNYVQLENNTKAYKEMLKQYNIREFHIGRLLYNENNIIEYF